LEKRLLEEFRREHRPVTQLARISRRTASIKWLLAAAAAVLLAIGLVVVLEQRPAEVSGVHGTTARSGGVEESATSSGPAPSQKTIVNRGGAEAPRRRKLKPRRFYDAMASAKKDNRGSGDREVATEFFPMTASPEFGDAESGQMLRVEL